MSEILHNRSPLPLPVDIDEIDRDWLTVALRQKAPGVSVRNFEILDINRGTCTKIRLRLDMDEAGRAAGIPERVILKGGFEDHSRSMDFMHENEVRGFRDVFPELGLNSPACYFTDFDPERGQGIIIMDDLVARGVTFCDPLKPRSFDQVARRLTALARFHARTWNSPELAPGGRWDRTMEVMSFLPVYMKQYLEPETWAHFVGSPRGAAASTRFHDRAWMADAIGRMALMSKPLPLCITHGDTHLGNLYIDTDGTPGFFDPQPQRAPGLWEIAYHVTGALDPADRCHWDRPLVGHYLDELARNGVEPPAFDDAMRQFAVFLVHGYLIFLINESHYQPEAINTAYTARFSAAMLDHDTIALLRTIA